MKTNFKKLVLVCSTLVLLILFGCKSDNIDSSESADVRESKHLELQQIAIQENLDKFEMKRHYNSLANPYLILLDNGLYKLDLSQEKAENIGIPPEVFKSIIEEINETNKKIIELKDRGIHIETPNPKDEVYKEEMEKIIYQLNNE